MCKQQNLSQKPISAHGRQNCPRPLSARTSKTTSSRINRFISRLDASSGHLTDHQPTSSNSLRKWTLGISYIKFHSSRVLRTTKRPPQKSRFPYQGALRIVINYYNPYDRRDTNSTRACSICISLTCTPRCVFQPLPPIQSPSCHKSYGGSSTSQHPRSHSSSKLPSASSQGFCRARDR